MTTPHPELATARLERTVAEIASSLRLGIAVVSVAAGVLCGRVAWRAPRFQMVYEDMLGPGAALPTVTQALLDHHTVFIASAMLISLVPVLVAIRARSLFVVTVVGAAAVLALLALGVMASLALHEPMQRLDEALVEALHMRLR
jgi:hypothetical protein